MVLDGKMKSCSRQVKTRGRPGWNEGRWKLEKWRVWDTAGVGADREAVFGAQISEGEARLGGS